MRDPEAEPAAQLSRREMLGVTAGAVLSLTTGCGNEGAGMDDGTEGSSEGSTGTPPDPTADSTGGSPPDLPGEPSIPFDPQAVPESVELFPRTPMAGEMKPESFWIAGHVATAEAITVRVWQPAALAGEVHLAFEQVVMPDPRGFFKLAVEGLRAGEPYEYGLFAGEAEPGFTARSLLGRVRTALPEGSLEPVTITGDVHMCYVGQVELDPATPGESMWEVCVTSGNSNPLANELPEAQFPWRSSEAHLPLITFDPGAGEGAGAVRVEFLTKSGNLAHSRELPLG